MITPPFQDGLRTIGLFFKTPVAGQVKTRLTPELSPAQAASLYEAFLLDTIDLCRSVPNAGLVLFDGSAVSTDPWPGLPADLPVLKQTGGDLGARMTHALNRLLDRGAGRAVLIGSDSPSLPPEVIGEAFDRLDHFDLVLGPVTDGGFYLIGVRDRVTSLLEGVPWSTRTVLKETMTRALASKLKVWLTWEWFDVDIFDDLHRLREDLGTHHRSPRTRQALGSLALAPEP